MINFVDWQITAGGQTEIRYYPEDYTYDDVYNASCNISTIVSFEVQK